MIEVTEGFHRAIEIPFCGVRQAGRYQEVSISLSTSLRLLSDPFANWENKFKVFSISILELFLNHYGHRQ